MRTARSLLAVLLGGAAAAAIAEDFDIRNPAEVQRLVPDGARIEKIAGGMQFVEGPVWTRAGGGYLIFSDIPANAIRKWRRPSGVVSMRRPSNGANGNTIDRRGRLLTAEHGGRRVSITERDGTVHTLVDSFEGKKLNSPNDVVVRSDGTVWFTDPDYGLAGRRKEQPGNFVYRYDPKTRRLDAVVRDFDKPNGLCFSPDEKRLYVADSGAPRHIRVFDVSPDGSLSGGRVFCVIDNGGPDGIRSDTGGRIWSSAGDGVHIFAPDGSLLGKILVPESPANLTFGGPDGRTLFITARTSLYSIRVSTTAARRP